MLQEIPVSHGPHSYVPGINVKVSSDDRDIRQAGSRASENKHVKEHASADQLSHLHAQNPHQQWTSPVVLKRQPPKRKAKQAEHTTAITRHWHPQPKSHYSSKGL